MINQSRTINETAINRYYSNLQLKCLEIVVVLKECKVCGELCSKNAKMCPSCGEPRPTETVSEGMERVSTVVVIIALIAVFAAWFFSYKFWTVLIIAVVVVALFMLFEQLVRAVINWERTIGFILFVPPAFWAMFEILSKNYTVMVIPIVLALPGLYLIFKHSNDKEV
jgi:RNA polymerase subunit RPABC4/transcription elongation factor Spt4